MRDLKFTYGNWCLVAGAAEGIGKAFAEFAARNKLGVILVDHQKEPLIRLGKQLENDYDVPVRLLHLDLGIEGSMERMMEAIGETSCRLLIYNAAYSRVRPFIDNEAGDLGCYVQVNIMTPLLLCHAFVSHFKGDRDTPKGIIMMSSMAGIWGTRFLSPYGASKAFTRIFAESLHHELREDGFDVLVSITGATATPGYFSSLPMERTPPGGVMQPERVVKQCFASLGRKSTIVPGFRNCLAFFLLTRVLAGSLSAKIMNREVSRLYRSL